MNISEDHCDNRMEQSACLSRLQTDLDTALKEFPRVSTGIKILSMKMQLSDRTLRRVLKGTHFPSYQTILKVYRYLLGTYTDKETISKMPKVLSEFVSYEHDNSTLLNSASNFSYDIDLLLKNDSVFRSIYVETATGSIHKSKVSYEHGKHGEKVLLKMVELDVIQETEEDVYTSSINRGSLSIETSQSISQFLLENKFTSDKSNLAGENFYSLFFEGVNLETYNEMLKIDWQAMQAKKKLLKNKDNRGSVKCWTLTFTDTLSTDLLYNEEKEVLQ